MEKKGWKILAIVSVILLIGSLAAIGWLFMLGSVQEYNRQVCAYDICGIREGMHDSYFYADLDNYCYCFSKGELDLVEDVNDFLRLQRDS